MNAILSQSVDSLGSQAANVAMKGAAEYLRTKGQKPNDAQIDAIVEALRRHTKNAVSSALADAKAAVEAGMGGFANATFFASMKLAGIAAAKEIVG